jgi:undecaprenyl-diphosphatase
MHFFETIMLGIIQGLTEFLPISSSGHLVLMQKLFGLKEGNLTFDTMLHLGTLLAVLIIFWTDIISMIKKPLSRLTILVVAGTIPTAIIGLSFKDFFERLFASGSTLGVEFIITGLILWWAESRPFGHKQLEEVTLADAGIIGVMQGIAILPAISRSGLTIAGALFRGIERDTAARFSFLLSIPSILGAVVLQAKDIRAQGLGDFQLLPMLVGTIMSAIFGYLAIKWMLKLITKGKLKYFAYYVWILGTVILVAQLLGRF